MGSSDDIKTDCPICLITYDSRLKFKQHTRWVHKKFEDEWAAIQSSTAGREIVLETKCNICEKMVLNQHTLKIHMDKMHRQVLDGTDCVLCSIDFENARKLYNHINNVHKKNVEEWTAINSTKQGRNLVLKTSCKFCEKKVFNQHTLKYHNFKVHMDKLQRQDGTECVVCSIDFENAIKLNNHINKVHRKNVEEWTAINSTKQGSNLVLKTNCKFCEKKVLNQHTLKLHTEKMHSMDEKLTDCVLCLVNFENTKKYKEHISNYHRKVKDEWTAITSKHAGEQVVLKSKCKFCMKKVFNQHTLRYHFDKVHREEENKKVWSCDYCKKEFRPEPKRVSHLTEHMRDDHSLPDWSFAEASQKPKAKGAQENFKMIMARLQGGK